MAVTTLKPPTPATMAKVANLRTPANRTYYTVTVDTEEEWDWPKGYPVGPASVANVARLPAFQRICERYGAAVTYYVNYAVLANPTSRRVIQDLAARPNVEIGLHIHPWNTPPIVTGSAPVPVRDTFLHNLPWDLARAKLDTLLEIFDQSGLQPTSYRGGRYSTSPQIQAYLRDRGIVADASVLPYSTWVDDGAPDYRGRDLTPRRLAPCDGSDQPLWELPLTFGYSRMPFGFWHRTFEWIESSPLRHLRMIGVLDRLGVVRKSWLNLENPLGRNLPGFLELLRRGRLPFVCLTLHSSSLMPGGSPYTQTEADAERILAMTASALATVANWPEFVPATVSQTAWYLEKEHHASDRD